MPEDIQRTLGRIEAKLDQAIADNRHQEKRISSLEHTRTRMVAYAAAVSAVASIGWDLLLSKVGIHG